MDGSYNGKPKASYDLTNKDIEKHPGSSNDVLTDKIFGYMSASLNINLFSKVERKKICTSFANVQIAKETYENGIEIITGTYKDIEKIYQCFQDLHQRQQSRERLHSGLNGSLEFGEKELSVNVSSAQYEYFNHVCHQEIEELKQRFHVRIDCSDNSDGTSSLYFIALHDGGQVEKARKSYIDLFQKIIGDWHQEVIELADRSHLDEVTKMLNEKYKRILTKKTTNSLILRGPKQELLEVKKHLKYMKKEQVAKPVDLAIQTFRRTNGIEVDLNQLELCCDLIKKVIKEIEQKYLVSKKLRNTQGPKVNIIFTPIKADLDLSEHAYEHFIFAFQRAVSNVSKKIINLKDFHPTGKLSTLIDSLANQFCDVSFQMVDETLTITGLLPRVMAAEKSLNLLLRRDLSHMRNVPIDSDSKKKDSDLAKKNSSPIKKSEAAAIEEQKATCPICLEIPTKKMILDKCKHEFCEQCLKTAMLHKPVCPVCNTPYGVVIGDQPDGRMAHSRIPDKLPGYHCGTIVIDYSIPDGIQGAKHPNPGQRFQGAHRRAYLPDNDEGRDILHLLKKAFNQKLIFTIGQSRTTGTSNTVTWNDIHHKTSMHGGPQSYGYPDLEYLKRVRDELKAKGIQ